MDGLINVADFSEVGLDEDDSFKVTHLPFQHAKVTSASLRVNGMHIIFVLFLPLNVGLALTTREGWVFSYVCNISSHFSASVH